MLGKPIGFWALCGLGAMIVLGAIKGPPVGAGGVGNWSRGTIPPSAPIPQKPSDAWQRSAVYNGRTGAMGQRRMPLAGP
jgi:hypothetical protein